MLWTNSFVQFYTARSISRIIFSTGSLAFLYFASLEAYGIFMFVVQQSTAIGRFALGATSETFLQDAAYGAFAAQALLLMCALFLLFSAAYYYSEVDLIGTSASVFFLLGCFTWVRVYGFRSLVTLSISNKSSRTGIYEIGIALAACTIYFFYYFGNEIAIGIVAGTVFLLNIVLVRSYVGDARSTDIGGFVKTSAAFNVGGASSSLLRFVDRSVLMVILGPIGFSIFTIGLLVSNVISVPLKMAVDYLFRFKETFHDVALGRMVLVAATLLVIFYLIAKLLHLFSLDQLNVLFGLIDKKLDSAEHQLILLIGFSYGVYVFLSQLTVTFLKLNNEFIVMPVITLLVALSSLCLAEYFKASQALFLDKIQYQYMLISIISLVAGVYFVKRRAQWARDER